MHLLKQLFKSIIDGLLFVMGNKDDREPPQPAPPLLHVPQDEPVVPPPPPPTPAPKYLWNTRPACIHSVRVICDEMGLTWNQKAEICATIEAESNFDPKAKLQNKKNGKVWSTDWGICQVNDFYHVGPGKAFASVQEILDYPERSVRFMCLCFKQGKIDLWTAHKNGSYKAFLKKHLVR